LVSGEIVSHRADVNQRQATSLGHPLGDGRQVSVKVNQNHGPGALGFVQKVGHGSGKMFEAQMIVPQGLGKGSVGSAHGEASFPASAER
jgi:hypothetical protein